MMDCCSADELPAAQPEAYPADLDPAGLAAVSCHASFMRKHVFAKLEPTSEHASVQFIFGTVCAPLVINASVLHASGYSGHSCFSSWVVCS